MLLPTKPTIHQRHHARRRLRGGSQHTESRGLGCMVTAAGGGDEQAVIGGSLKSSTQSPSSSDSLPLWLTDTRSRDALYALPCKRSIVTVCVGLLQLFEHKSVPVSSPALTTTSRCSTRPRQEATACGVRWALLCTGTGVGERDAEVASAASVHFPTPLHAPELVHGLYVPATSTCYGISSASGDSSPAGDTTPRRRYCCRELCSATTPLYLRGLTTSIACSRLRLGGGPQEDLGGGVLVLVNIALGVYCRSYFWTGNCRPGITGTERVWSWKIPGARLHNTETET